MLYANVVLGLPIDGPFDYLVPPDLGNKISVGTRVWVNFRNKKEVAYIVELSDKTTIKKLKEISTLIDTEPILDEKMFLLTRQLAGYYCCSWGEAIEAALPDEIRKGKEVKKGDGSLLINKEKENRPLFLKVRPFFLLQGANRTDVYLKEIKLAVSNRESVIVIFTDINAVLKAADVIRQSLKIIPQVLYRKQPKELGAWISVRQSDFSVVLGTRSSIFAPVNNLGLIIVDQEEDQVYKQEQVPHYHVREVALMRAEIESARIILGSHSPSLESFHLVENGQLQYQCVPSGFAYPQVKVIDLRRLPYSERKTKTLFSKFLIDAIAVTLAQKGKILLLINRKGFATSAACHNCGVVLKCPRCNINLVFHFDEEKLKCHHCNFKMDVPKACPSCNTGYIKYSGMGTEKAESELARIFPQARMDEDIFVATSSVIKHPGINFDLIGVLAIDNSLNRVDFRAAEKTFNLLMGLVNLTSKTMIIQSANASHHCFQALIKNDPGLFYKEELKQRKQLNFAPFKHMILVRLRGESLEKVKQAAGDLFSKLNKIKTNSLKMLSLNPGQPAKLRGNFYYQILMRAPSVEKASHFLKLHLKETHFSGIIVTVDVDPI
ncbi:MAG: primosomal protein N' [Candidatus Omnitrophica bacterium]|nr:primosomal protein N' [Candidatus Omnitrophota bacterium]